jgi:nicotinate dehydrogenase subunit B
MRTLGAFSNIFAIESAMDELAQLAQVDPLDFRLRHLSDARMAAVLEACAYHFGWRERHHSQVAGVGFGLGMSQYKNAQTRAATAVQLCVQDDGNIQLQRMVIAADAGSVVDENGLKAQLEGGALQAASWTLYEAVQFDESGILSSDWDSYPILRFANVPDIQVVLLDDPSLPSVGAGEASSGPTGGAIANALADATGLRLRELPLTADAVRETALKAND